jgi:hypothetical protein
MAAILGRPGGKRRKGGYAPQNTYVEDQGRRYRVCHLPHGRVLMVMLKCPAGGERPLKVEARRARQIVKLSGVELAPGVGSRP